MRGRQESQTGASVREDVTTLAVCQGTAGRTDPAAALSSPSSWGAGFRVKASLTPVPCCLCPQLTLLVVQVSILYYGGHLVISGQMTSGNLISFIIYEFVLGDCMEVRGWLGEGSPGEREERVGERDLNGVLQGLRDVGCLSKVGRGEIIMTPATIINLVSDSNSARGAEGQQQTLFQKMHMECLGVVPIPVSQKRKPRLRDVTRLTRHVCGHPGGSDFRLTHCNTRCRGKDRGRLRVCLHLGPPASRS